jgi:cardiolipin synthase
MNRIMVFLKKTLKLLFNRIFYVALALLLQLGWFFMLIWRIAAYSRYVSVAISLLGVLVVLFIVNKKINPAYKLAWTILILAAPIFGLALYLLFGESRIAKEIQCKFDKIQDETREYLQQNPQTIERLQEDSSSAALQSQYITRYSGFPVWENTSTEFFQVGDDMFPVLMRELEQAKRFIFIEYFIINDGVMWQNILDILKRKAAEGVDVRLIYDGFGCLTTLPNKYYEQMRQVGIKCEVFNAFRPILNVIQNNRDHRKLCIIDGYVGFTGGINLADEYINQKRRFGHWKDTAVMLTGEGVWNMTSMFLSMWNVVTGAKEVENYEDYLPHRYHPHSFIGDGFVQPFSDSPLDSEIISENVYLNLINRARKYVYICTPYLIIDNEMMTALCLAAKSGVDVKIMTPGIPDKKIVFLLTQSYYEQLLEAGVEIYEYMPGFLHAKSMVCDDETAVIGTINLDYRSLYLHFEDGVWMYKNRVVTEMRKDFTENMINCNRISLSFCRNRNILIRGVQSIMRLLAPLL